jgi:hypothetical protein
MVRISGIGLINACKVATAASIAAFAFAFKGGRTALRGPLYVALHGSYLGWWFVHQRLSPTWGPTVFPTSDMPIPAVALVFLAIGPGYALPGFFAFRSTREVGAAELVGSIALFAWGSLLNCAGDFYKDGAKSAKPGATVMTGPFRLARHISWFGDWMRYASFTLASGAALSNPLAYLPLAFTMTLNLSSLAQRREGQAKRGAAAQKYIASTPAVVPVRLLF